MDLGQKGFWKKKGLVKFSMLGLEKQVVRRETRLFFFLE